MKKLIIIAIAALAAAGCSTTSTPENCKQAISAYQLYQASLADGRVPSADERRIALAAAAFLQLQCGWSPVGPATATKGAPTTDSNGVPYLIP
jgi:hypothetical protein